MAIISCAVQYALVAFIYLFMYLCMYVCMYGCVGPSLLRAGFLWLQ